MSKDKEKEVEIEVTSAFVYDGKILKPGKKTKVLAGDARSFASRGKCLIVGGGDAAKAGDGEISGKSGAAGDPKAAKAGDGEKDK